jgi:hypothetical protein
MQVSPVHTPHRPGVPSSTTPRTSRTASMATHRGACCPLLPGVGFASADSPPIAGSPIRHAESRSSSYGPSVLLPLLSTPLCSDAVGLGFQAGLPSAWAGTHTLLIWCAVGRTIAGVPPARQIARASARTPIGAGAARGAMAAGLDCRCGSLPTHAGGQLATIPWLSSGHVLARHHDESHDHE